MSLKMFLALSLRCFLFDDLVLFCGLRAILSMLNL